MYALRKSLAEACEAANVPRTLGSRYWVRLAACRAARTASRASFGLGCPWEIAQARLFNAITFWESYCSVARHNLRSSLHATCLRQAPSIQNQHSRAPAITAPMRPSRHDRAALSSPKTRRRVSPTPGRYRYRSAATCVLIGTIPETGKMRMRNHSVHSTVGRRALRKRHIQKPTAASITKAAA